MVFKRQTSSYTALSKRYEMEIKENIPHLESNFAGTFQCDKQVKVHLKIRLEKKDQQQRDC